MLEREFVKKSESHALGCALSAVALREELWVIFM